MSTSLPKTELPYPSTHTIDELPLMESLKLLADDQLNAIKVIKLSSLEILKVIKQIYNHLLKNKNARIIYCGAGTSGRIGVQDGVELTPTFGWPRNKIKFLLAGGKKALLYSVENAEDDKTDALKKVNKTGINENDVVIALAASGNTPFTNEVLKLSTKKNALTIAISNNPKGCILKNAKLKVILDTQQEVLAGSTRLKAGTSQKICLNIISTLVMMKLGRVKKGMMVSMLPTNKKLIKRKIFIEKNMKIDN